MGGGTTSTNAFPRPLTAAEMALTTDDVSSLACPPSWLQISRTRPSKPPSSSVLASREAAERTSEGF